MAASCSAARSSSDDDAAPEASPRLDGGTHRSGRQGDRPMSGDVGPASRRQAALLDVPTGPSAPNHMRNTLRIVMGNSRRAATGPEPHRRTQAELFASVFVLAQHLSRLGDVELAALDLTTKQWLLLAVLQRRFPDRRPTLSEAAAVYGSSRQNVKAIANTLATRGYLRLLPDPSDRRAVRLQVTERTAVFSTAEWAARERLFFDHVFEGFDRAELPELLELVRRWVHAVTPAIDPPAGHAAEPTPEGSE